MGSGFRQNFKKKKLKRMFFKTFYLTFFQNQSAILTTGFGFDNLKWVSTDPS